ncbi:MAG TPA: hypothetical protein VKQ52_21365, partial [Puia sp.]|nr:hypothetical protein [Puia sp.]
QGLPPKQIQPPKRPQALHAASHPSTAGKNKKNPPPRQTVLYQRFYRPGLARLREAATLRNLDQKNIFRQFFAAIQIPSAKTILTYLKTITPHLWT